MTDILKLNVNDESINNVISNNPFYINITGSVNICLTRCGQTIETCNEINFSTMTNYGKILVLNPNTSKKSNCSIKLAFDTSNDNIDNNGTSNYTFEKAFFTVPSLHRLNGQIYDLETFMLFSSIQKNGNVLYVCLCSLSSAISVVQQGDWKLLNYKLMNELFVKNNSVPDVYGTNAINGIPNPVDLTNFIPQEGSRNFYDYTHPSNTNVNIRVFQTPLAVSNDVINMLKSKLTPGNIYINFKAAINKSINPTNNLFFYFSQDLTNNYKSYENNKTSTSTKSKEKDTFENIEDTNLDSNQDTKQDTKQDKSKDAKDSKESKDTINKLDVDKNSEILDEENNDKDFDEKKKVEKFEDPTPVAMNNITTSFFIIILFFLLIYNIFSVYKITNFFTPEDTNSSSSSTIYNLSEITKDFTPNVLTARFGLASNVVMHVFLTVIVVALCLFQMATDYKELPIYIAIIVLSVFIVLLGINSVRLGFSYFLNRLKCLGDEQFSQKEEYFYNYINKKIYKEEINIGNIIKYLVLSFIKFGQFDFSQFSGATLPNTTILPKIWQVGQIIMQMLLLPLLPIHLMLQMLLHQKQIVQTFQMLIMLFLDQVYKIILKIKKHKILLKEQK